MNKIKRKEIIHCLDLLIIMLKITFKINTNVQFKSKIK